MTPFKEEYGGNLFTHAEHDHPDISTSPPPAKAETNQTPEDMRNRPLTEEEVEALPAELVELYESVGYPGSKRLAEYYKKLDSLNR